jgi:hypothetical protein
MVIPASSTEYLHVPVTAPAGADLTATAVQIAVVAHSANPAGAEWQDATWQDGAARILVGPGTSTPLAPGDYKVWLRVDPPGAEDIVRKAGILTVT